MTLSYWTSLSADDGPHDHYNLSAAPVAYIVALRLAFGLSCSLSLIGVFLITLSYLAAGKELRTLPRFLLLNLSLANAFRCSAVILNLVHHAGTFHRSHNEESPPDAACVLEGALLVFGKNSATFWSVCLTTYLFAVLVADARHLAKALLPVLVFLCWLAPLCLTLWLALDGRLGYQYRDKDLYSCSIVDRERRVNGTGWSVRAEAMLLGFDLWNYLALVALSAMFFGLWLKLRKERKEQSRWYVAWYISTNRLPAVDNKLIWVPAIFVLLRVWWAIISIASYLPESLWLSYNQSYFSYFMLFIVVLTDPLQGFVNALLFCFLTAVVRSRLRGVFSHFFCHWLCCRRKYVFHATGSYVTRVQHIGSYSQETTPMFSSLSSAQNAHGGPGSVPESISTVPTSGTALGSSNRVSGHGPAVLYQHRGYINH